MLNQFSRILRSVCRFWDWREVRMSQRVYGLGILLLASTLLIAPLYGQSTNGSISGTIEDTSKAILPGVTVTATNAATDVVSTSITNEAGAYNFLNLPPGQYKLTAELP